MLIKLNQSLIPDHRSQLGQESELPKLIVEYFNKFGSKLVSYADIVKYLDKLTNVQRQDVYKELSSMFRDKEIGNQADICRDVNIWQLKRYCGLMEDMSVDELLEEVDKLGDYIFYMYVLLKKFNLRIIFYVPIKKYFKYFQFVGIGVSSIWFVTW